MTNQAEAEAAANHGANRRRRLWNQEGPGGARGDRGTTPPPTDTLPNGSQRPRPPGAIGPPGGGPRFR
jgi:hypothetical protein